MNNSDSAYCRLCAELKVKTKMTNLQENNEKKIEIINKLSRLNANMDLCGNMLPKTVCFVCINSLDSAIEFVTAVEHAQKVLNNMLLVKIKEEDSISNNKSCTNEVRNNNDDDIEVSENNIKLEILKSDKPSQSDFTDNQSETPDENCSDNDEERMATESVENSSDATPDQSKLTWKDYSWTCAYCETQFQSVDELRAHSIQYHNCCNAFKCTDCNNRNSKLDTFIKHVKRHKEFLKVSCYSCYSRFANSLQVITHTTTHVTSKYSCKGCNSMFDNMREMNRHIKLYYRDLRTKEVPMMSRLSDNLTCLLCKKSYKNKTSLNTHLLIHTERRKDHTCEKCGKSFFSKHGLVDHILIHSDDRPFKCDKCNASFKTSKHLHQHSGVHNHQKKFECEQCGKQFRLQSQLSSHKIIHTDLLPYVCTYCNKHFRFQTILKQHIRLHTGVRPYSCEVCGRDFTNWSNYNKHMKRRHDRDMSKKKQPPEEGTQ